MELFTENPGLSHIGERILINLDFTTQLTCRLVKRSWKYILDKEASTIDVEKFFENLFVTTEIEDDNYFLWIHFIRRCVNSTLRTNVFIKTYLLTVIKKMIKSKDVDNSPLEEFYSRKNDKFLKMILNEKMYTYNDFEQITKHALLFDQIHIIKILIRYFNSDLFKGSINWATRKGRLDILKVLLNENSKTSLVLKNNELKPIYWGKNIIHIAAKNGQLEIVKTFCSKVNNPMAKDKFGNLPIHYAALKGHLENVKFLTNFSSNPFVQNKLRLTPLDLAKRNLETEVVEYLSSFKDVKSLSN